MLENYTKQDYIATREDYINIIKDELLGPGSEISLPDKEHEIISDRPEYRYFLGVLFPEEKKKEEGQDGAESREDGGSDDLGATDDEDDEDVSDGLEEGETQRQDADDYSDDDDDDVEAAPEEKVNVRDHNKPSSMGISFLAEGECNHLVVDVSFATYEKLPPDQCYAYFPVDEPDKLNIPPMLQEYVCYEKEMQSFRAKKDGLKQKYVRQVYEGYEPPEGDLYNLYYPILELARHQRKRGCYKRIPHEKTIMLDFSVNEFTEDTEQGIDGTPAKLTGLKRHYRGNIWSYTIMLSHDKKTAESLKGKGVGSKVCLMQPCIKITSKDNGFVFRENKANTNFDLLNDEEKSLELQYRNKKTYATGLSVSAGWEIDQDGQGEIHTEFYPQSEVPQVDFSLPDEEKYQINKKALSMHFLSDLDKSGRDAKLEALSTIPAAYQKWINEQKASIDDRVPSLYHAIAKKNMSGCEDACKRMAEGIQELKTNGLAWEAFQLANRAMFMQRVHIGLQTNRLERAHYPGDPETAECLKKIKEAGYENADLLKGIIETPNEKFEWRLFQIAFLLMSVCSIVKEDSPDRDIVDLIWFPTGGGKTEAYLGLTALTIFYRRLTHKDDGGGTSVIMRYTLRLLTSQQFTRASTLICACECIREDATSRSSKYGRHDLGNERISIGLWIGNAHTPGTLDAARKAYNKLTSKEVKAKDIRYVSDKYNHFQLLKCPWCGTKLIKEKQGAELVGKWGYECEKHFSIHCTHASCYFNDELPIQVVDDELYKAPPTLLFSTVDKFAMLPWDARIGSFFGVGNKNHTPDLIIQDELHLISGALGTIVGLYESVIDELCSHKGVKPKIIASTATIRRAREQCAALYSREAAQFPHPAIDSDNSFFSREAVIDYADGKYGRKYVGLLPAGKSKDLTEARVIAALMQRIYSMGLPDKIKDSYWTLTAYYNSLRELGKAETLVEDDANDFIRHIAKRTANRFRIIPVIDKLNSHIKSTKLNETLDKLEKISYSKENREKKQYAADILLATNMISVGIDISRLNVMLMVEQPKLTSEYIQASSRVGRRDPGVVFVQYDSTRSRDRSHYEQFKSYHEAYYKFVEPTGVTPFSKPARDRALHAIIISLLRIEEAKLREDKNAGEFTENEYKEQIAHIGNMLIERYRYISSVLTPDAEDESGRIQEEIDEVIHTWDLFANDSFGGTFCYGRSYLTPYDSKKDENVRRLLKTFDDKHQFSGENPFATMTSMRNVDGNVGGTILVLEDE